MTEKLKRLKVGEICHVEGTMRHAKVLRHGEDSTGKFTEVRFEDADGEIVRVNREAAQYCPCSR